MSNMVTEVDQPEDSPNPLRGQREKKKEETVVVAIKPSKAKMTKLFSDLKSALKMSDKAKLTKILDSIDLTKLDEDGKVRNTLFEKSDEQNIRDSDIIDYDDSTTINRKRSESKMSERKHPDDDEADDNEDDYSKESQKETERRSAVKKIFEDFIEKLKKNVPDPIATNKGLSMSYKNLTLYGLTQMKICGSVRKNLGSDFWNSEICLPRLTTTIDCVTGPGVPFRGKVVGVFKEPKIKIKFHETENSKLHVDSVKTISTSDSKFVPTYDSSIPLNPWSKISMSGYMVARVKKMLPTLMDKTLLKITHIIENMDEE